jgi:uncharacterized protein YjbI with pentapeptide repeats
MALLLPVMVCLIFFSSVSVEAISSDVCQQYYDIKRARCRPNICAVGSQCELTKDREPVCVRTSAVSKHFIDDDCLSIKSAENLQVPFSHQCIIETARELNLNDLINHTKLRKLLDKAKITYMAWRSGGSTTAPDHLYNAVLVLNAAEILVQQGKLLAPYTTILNNGLISKLHDHRAGSLPRFHPAVDACPCEFLRSAAVIKAVQVLSNFRPRVLLHSPLTVSNCPFHTTVKLPCLAMRSSGSQGKTQWFFHGKKIHIQQSHRHDLDTKGALIIREFSPDDLGRYKCRVTNSMGVIDSQVSVSSDKCPCSFDTLQADQRTIRHRALTCLSAQRIHVTGTTISDVSIDEVSLKGGTVEDLRVNNSKIKRLSVENLRSLRDVVIENSDIGVIHLANLTGVRVVLRNVNILQLFTFRISLSDSQFEDCFISSMEVSFSNFTNCGIRDTRLYNSYIANTSIVELTLHRSFISGLVSNNVNYLDSYLVGLTVEHSVFNNDTLRNYTTVQSNRFNLTTVNMDASHLRSIDATLVNDITVNATYRYLEVVNITVVNASSYNAKFIETEFQNSTFDSASWHGAMFADSSFRTTSFDRLVLNQSSISNLSITTTNFTNTLLSDVDHENSGFQDIQIKNYTTVNATHRNLVIENMMATKMTSHNALIINETTRNSVYINLVERGKMGFHCSAYQVDYMDSSLEESVLQSVSMNYLKFHNQKFHRNRLHNSSIANTEIVGLNLTSTFISGLVSSNVSYLDNHLFGLTVEHSVFNNDILRNYTTIQSNRLNLTTINMTASHFRSIDATLVNDVTINATYRHLEVVNLTVVNASSHNAKFIETEFQNSTFDSASWHGALFANSTLSSTSFDRLVLNGSSISNLSVTTTNFTNTLLSKLDSENSVFQNIQLANYTTIHATRRNLVTTNMVATKMTSQNALLIDETTRATVYIDLVTIGMKAFNCTCHHVDYINSSMEDSSFHSISMRNSKFYDQKLLRNKFQHSEFASSVFYLLDVRHAILEHMIFNSTTIANMKSDNSSWTAILMTNTRLACPLFTGGFLNNFTIQQSVLAHVEFTNNRKKDFEILRSVVDEIGWESVDGDGIALRDVRASRMQMKNTSCTGFELTNVSVLSLQFTQNKLSVRRCEGFVVRKAQLWNMTRPTGVRLSAFKKADVSREPFEYGISKPCNIMAGANNVSSMQSQLCSNANNYASCAVDQLVVDIINVSTSHCHQQADAIFERVRHLCLHKSSCSIDSSFLGLNCPKPDICLQVSYMCKPIVQVINEDLKVVFQTGQAAIFLQFPVENEMLYHQTLDAEDN